MANFNIISIDPGNNLGISIYTIDDEDYKIVNIETIFLVLNNYASEDGDGYDKINSKLKYLKDYMTKVMKDYKPLALGIETSFLNMRFPKAVIQLSQYLAIIESVSKEVYSGIKIFRYSPKYIKSKIDAGGDAKKDDMTSAVSKIKEITSKIKIDKLTEHEIDSLAIGYVMLKEIRQYPLVLCALCT